MSDLGPRGPEHADWSIRFHRNLQPRTSGPKSPVEARQGEPRPPSGDLPPTCWNCDKTGCTDLVLCAGGRGPSRPSEHSPFHNRDEDATTDE